MLAVTILALTQCAATIGGLSLLGYASKEYIKDMEKEKQQTETALKEQDRLTKEAEWRRQGQERRRANEQAERERAKETAWKEFYQPLPECGKQNAIWDEVIKCSNDKIKKKGEFEKLWGNNQGYAVTHPPSKWQR